jgi:short-subunit dehydrogenase
MSSMKGKRVLITGPTSGVGKEIAAQLAARGAELILGCRDIKQGNRIASEIARQTSLAKPKVMQIDASSQKSIRALAREFRRQYRRLDVLINNAAGNRALCQRLIAWMASS